MKLTKEKEKLKMITFFKNDMKFVEAEKDIMNSNQEYNLIAYEKKNLEMRIF